MFGMVQNNCIWAFHSDEFLCSSTQSRSPQC